MTGDPQALAARIREAQRERDYIERTIETVRNHRDADNCWPQWANIFADEIEKYWALTAELVQEAERYEKESKTLRNEVERLRSGSEIPALREMVSAQVETLRIAEENRDQWHSIANQAEAERDAAVQEAERARAALRDAASAAGHPDAAEGCRNVIRIVRAALAKGEQREEPQVLRCGECGAALELGHDCLAGEQPHGETR